MNKQIREAARSPHTFPQGLFLFAEDFPHEVLANELLPLLALEDPAQYARILVRAQSGLLKEEINQKLLCLSPKEQSLFLADCVEHVLPLYEQEHPDDQRIHCALALIRKAVLSEVSLEERQLIRQSVFDAGEEANDNGAALVAFAAAYLVLPEEGDLSCVESAAEAVKERTDSSEALLTERRWQQERLLLYLDALPTKNVGG
jgi:hypothetical protein